jgi:Tfp pilus assembly protein FimV
MKLRTVIGACTLIAAIPFTTQAGLNSNGNWEVTRGDTLYNIARRVAPGNGKEQARIRKHMFNKNPSAFKNNNPGALEVGKTLSLPGAAAVVVSKPKPKAVVKPAVIVPAIVAPVVSAPKVSVPTPAVSAPKPTVAAPAPKADSFKARIEAKRIAKEAADKRRAEAAKLAAEQAAQAEAAAAQQAAQQAAAQAAAQAKQREAAAMAAKQKAAARQKAAAQAAKKAAAAAKAAKPKPTPRAIKANNTTNAANPYVECKTTKPDEKCGSWNITYKNK